MNLQEILFGTFVPPEIPGRTHRIGFTSIYRYTPPKPRVHNRPVRDKSKTSEEIILKAVKDAGVPVTSVDISIAIKMTRNHCGIILGQLFKEGLVNRVRCTKGSVRFYKYTAKDL